MATTPELTRFNTEKNARVYHLGDPASATEVWYVLLGFGQLAGSFISAFEPARRPGRVIVAPEALNHFYVDHRARKVGASWMTSEDRDAQIADYVRYLDAVAEQIQSGARISRTEVHGFSQGSATAARWVAMGKVRPARLVIWGGELPPDPAVEIWKDRLNAVDLTIVMGDRDEYYNRDRVDLAAERLDAAGVRHTSHRFSGGHVVSPEVLALLAGG
jgi:predicted esterase